MAIHVHAACLSDRQNYLDPDPTYKDAYDLPLLGVTFDWHHNGLCTMDYMNERCIEIDRAPNGSHTDARNKSTHSGIVGSQSTHNVGDAAMGNDP